MGAMTRRSRRRTQRQGGATLAAAAATAPRGHSWAARLRALPAMVGAVLSGRWQGVGKLQLAGYAAALLYVVSPLDFVPELLLGPFGLADDVAVAALAVTGLVRGVDAWLTDCETGVTGTAPPRTIPGEVVDPKR